MDEPTPPAHDYLADILRELLHNHGVMASLEGSLVVVPITGIRFEAGISDFHDARQGASVQLDVLVHLPSGEIIIESFAGVANSRQGAFANAVHNFTANSFHVFLTAFCGIKSQYTVEEEWSIGGRSKTVFIGNVGFRCKPTLQEELATLQWFPVLEDRIRSYDIGGGVHWIRFFYSQFQFNKIMQCEVLLDNHQWTEVESYMLRFPWLQSEEFYSIRLFMVLVDPPKA
jgi:hypothetical protein